MSQNLKFIIELSKKAGRKILKNVDNARLIKSQDIRDVTTNLDLESEKIITSAIQKKFPGHNIMREEEDNINNQSNYSWTIDPLDGTKYFYKGIKFFSVSIALWKNNEPTIGVVYNPCTNDCYWAEKNKGAFLNGKKLQVSKIKNISEAIIYLDFQSKKHAKIQEEILEKRLLKIYKNFYRFRTFGCGSLALCFLAQGYFDAYFDINGSQPIIDSGGGMIIAKEAGAKITDLNGKYPGMNANHMVITNNKIHDQVLKILK